MEYILKSVEPRKIPYTNKENVYGIDVLIRTAIVGQTYIGFENIDLSFCPIEKTDTSDSIEVKINNFAKIFISEKYKKTNKF